MVKFFSGPPYISTTISESFIHTHTHTQYIQNCKLHLHTHVTNSSTKITWVRKHKTHQQGSSKLLLRLSAAERRSCSSWTAEDQLAESMLTLQ